MKKSITTIVLALFAITLLSAENIVQVTPFQTTKGVAKTEKKSFSVHMCNTTPVLSVEFKIFLPEGMDITRTTATARVPKDTEWDENYYTCQYSDKQEDGSYKVVLVNVTNKETITGTSGAVIQVYYQTDGDMADGIYPIKVSDVILGDVNSQAIELTAEKSSSYVCIGETSPLKTDQDLNLNALTDYLPSFVMESLNSDMAANENLRSLKMTGATAMGAALTVPENVVYETATTGGLKRSFPGGQKSTVCLPFALSEEQVTAVKEKGCAIEVLSGYNADKSSVKFTDVTTMAAHTPYLVTVTGEMPVALFDGLTGIEADLTAMPTDVVQEPLSMKGSYEKSTISSETGLARYAYDVADGSFVRIGSNATLLPYRAYLELASSTAASRLVISDDETTGIGNLNVNVNDNLNGDGNATFSDLQGRRIDEADAKGVYIKNGRKFIKK